MALKLIQNKMSLIAEVDDVKLYSQEGYPYQNIRYGKMVSRKNGSYFIPIKYEMEPGRRPVNAYVCGEKTNIRRIEKLDEQEGFMELEVPTNSQYDFLIGLDEFIVNDISKHSSEWFKNDLSSGVVDFYYKSTMKPLRDRKNTFSLKIKVDEDNDELKAGIYDTNGDPIPDLTLDNIEDYLNPVNPVLPAYQIAGITFTKNRSQLELVLYQLKVKSTIKKLKNFEVDTEAVDSSDSEPEADN